MPANRLQAKAAECRSTNALSLLKKEKTLIHFCKKRSCIFVCCLFCVIFVITVFSWILFNTIRSLILIAFCCDHSIALSNSYKAVLCYFYDLWFIFLLIIAVRFFLYFYCISLIYIFIPLFHIWWSVLTQGVTKLCVYVIHNEKSCTYVKICFLK